MSWLQLLRVTLALADKLAEIVRDRQLIDAGERREIARALGRIAERAGVMREIAAATAGLSDAELDRALTEDDR